VASFDTVYPENFEVCIRGGPIPVFANTFDTDMSVKYLADTDIKH